jgi:hypothetical protein
MRTAVIRDWFAAGFANAAPPVGAAGVGDVAAVIIKIGDNN